MTVSIKVSGSVAPIVRDLDRVQRKVVPAATASALNKINKKIITTATDGIAERYNLKKRTARKTIRVGRFGKATRRRLRAGGKLSVFVPVGSAPQGIRWYFDEGKPRRPLNNSQFHAKLKKKGGKPLVTRAGKSVANWKRVKRPDGQWTELPIRLLFTDQSIASLDIVESAMAKRGQEWDAEFQHALWFFLQRQSGRL